MKSGKGKRGGLRAVLYLVALLCLAGIGYSGYRVFGIQSEYAKSDNLYGALRKEMQAAQADSNSQSADIANADSMAAGGRIEGEALAQKAASQMDFDELRARNDDTVAWITIPNTKIDYPVVQGEDNDYYLNRLFTREYGSAGSIFMQYTNAPDFSDKHTILFGHHMNNGSMFAGLDKYRNQKYYDEHPTMTLYAPGGDHTVEWFASYAITAAPLPTAFDSDSAFIEYVAGAKAKSTFKSDVEILPTDRIITLCTCSYVSDDARYILIGVIR